MARNLDPNAVSAAARGKALPGRARSVSLTKCAIERRSYAPGSMAKIRSAFVGLRCPSARKAKFAVSMACSKASSAKHLLRQSVAKGQTGETCCSCWSRALDAVAYRMGFGASVLNRVRLFVTTVFWLTASAWNIPSSFCRPGDVVELADKTCGQLRVKAAMEAAESRGSPGGWKLISRNGKGTFKARRSAANCRRRSTKASSSNCIQEQSQTRRPHKAKDSTCKPDF